MEQNKRIEKLISQLNKKKQVQNLQIIQDLKVKGFKKVKPYPNLFINEYGKVYNINTRKELKAGRKNTVLVKGCKRISIPKLVLLVFRNEPIKEKTHIRYLDGNRDNLSLSNVKYNRTHENKLKSEVNAENLRTVIRCYFEVPEHYNVKYHILTRMYLTEIMRKRYFYEENYKRSGFDIFKSYMKGCTNNVRTVSKEHYTSISDVQIVVNEFTNLLINDILADLEAGTLKVNDYLPRPKTKTQVIRETNEYLKEMGLKPLPLRKKSAKEKLRDFKKYSQELKNRTITKDFQ